MQVLTFPTACPKCGGKLYDNRTGHSKFPKKNPKAPDGKCANKACDGVIWPPKPGQVWADDVSPQAVPATAPPQYGGPMPFDPPSEVRAVPDMIVGPARKVTTPDLAELFALYKECTLYVLTNIEPMLNEKQIGADPQATVAAIATLFIAAKGRAA